MPDMPIADVKVAEELEALCSDNNCLNLNNWLNELYFFKQQYLIIKTLKDNHEKTT